MLYTFSDVIGNKELNIQTGKKAASLIQMLEWGLPVPEGACITIEAFDEFLALNRIRDLASKYTGISGAWEKAAYTADLRESTMNGNLPPMLMSKIDGFLEKNPGKSFAIRSSGTGEDLQNASFAGQYTTILNVKSKNDILNSIKKCWASQFDKQILEYCSKNEIDIGSLKMAVIIQEMIPAQKSGVVFTVNPLEGFDRQMVIEACFGLGEALVNGEVTPDRYYYDWYNKKEYSRTIGSKDIAFEPEEGPSFTKRVRLPSQKRNTAVLSPEEVEEISLLALKTQAHYGFPIDMEWAKYDGKFYILQSRPITKISFGGIEGHWTTANFKDGGVSATVCIPYLWSLYDMI